MSSIDITNLTDAALDVVFDVRSGVDCVVVDHLSYEERVSVCKALGIKARQHWLMAAPGSNASVAHSDLDRQDRDGEI